MNCPKIPVSIGELLDKITILQIKSSHSDDECIKRELNELINIAEQLNVYNSSYLIELKTINKILWNIEDQIRMKEKNKQFDDEFIKLARSVYITNDDRAKIKKQINQETRSLYNEIKIFS
jgi:peptide methionine sulfoxide reductase MsrA